MVSHLPSMRTRDPFESRHPNYGATCKCYLTQGFSLRYCEHDNPNYRLKLQVNFDAPQKLVLGAFTVHSHDLQKKQHRRRGSSFLRLDPSKMRFSCCSPFKTTKGPMLVWGSWKIKGPQKQVLVNDPKSLSCMHLREAETKESKKQALLWTVTGGIEPTRLAEEPPKSSI